MLGSPTNDEECQDDIRPRDHTSRSCWSTKKTVRRPQKKSGFDGADAEMQHIPKLFGTLFCAEQFVVYRRGHERARVTGDGGGDGESHHWSGELGPRELQRAHPVLGTTAGQFGGVRRLRVTCRAECRASVRTHESPLSLSRGLRPEDTEVQFGLLALVRAGLPWEFTLPVANQFAALAVKPC